MFSVINVFPCLHMSKSALGLENREVSKTARMPFFRASKQCLRGQEGRLALETVQRGVLGGRSSILMP